MICAPWQVKDKAEDSPRSNVVRLPATPPHNLCRLLALLKASHNKLRLVHVLHSLDVQSLM